MKTFTSKQLQKLIIENNQESRQEWMLWMMERAGEKNSNVKQRQFWQQNNKPIELWSAKVIDQKVDYIHQNRIIGNIAVPSIIPEAMDYWILIMYNYETEYDTSYKLAPAGDLFIHDGAYTTP